MGGIPFLQSQEVGACQVRRGGSRYGTSDLGKINECFLALKGDLCGGGGRVVHQGKRNNR